MMPPYFSIVICAGPNGEFSNKNQMAWPRIKEELAHFKATTMANSTPAMPNVVIMGRNTWESLKSKPLPGRHNIVISSKGLFSHSNGFWTARSLDDALTISQKLINDKEASSGIYLIGGCSLAEEGMLHPLFEYLYDTLIEPLDGSIIEADNYFNVGYRTRHRAARQEISRRESQEGAYKLTYSKYSPLHREHPERVYLDLCRKVLDQGKTKVDRTGTGTIATFGEHMEFDLSKGFPLYTTKRVFFRGVVEELLFFLSGKTQTRVLVEKGIKIWQGNTSRTYLDSHGFKNYQEGEIGPGYPFQWRHFGAKYIPNVQLEINNSDTIDGGVDQIANVIRDIATVKASPSDSRGRRLLISAWNPVDADKMVLPCCHYAFQFSVEDDRLNISVEMRSNDAFLGSPMNVASYALLTHMIAYLTGLKPGKLVLNVGDFHIYNNAIEAMNEQLTRPPRSWPTLVIIGNPQDIDSFTMENFKLIDYHPHPALEKVEMAI